MEKNEERIAHITSGNIKLGANILQVNQPPIVTCRCDAPCKNLCYGLKGRFTWDNCTKSQKANYFNYLKYKNKFFDYIIDYINNSLITYKYFRWHSTGDIVDYNYFCGMVRVARKCKDTKFLVFTKRFEIVNQFVSEGHRIPKNLNILFSAWDKSFKVENPYNFPVAYVDFKDKEKNPSIPPLAMPCGGRCYECLGCWQLRKGQAVIMKEH